jgi:recombination protein RecA
MSQALRKIAGAVSKSNCLIIFINQLREKIGVMYGSPEVTTGGRALKFYSSVRLDVRRIETLKRGQDMIGSRTRAKVVKNKVAAPFKLAEFDIMYGTGISREGCIVDLGAELGIIQKSGAWYSYKEERLGQGRENVKLFMAENPEMTDEIEKRIRVETGIIKEEPKKGKKEEAKQGKKDEPKKEKAEKK